LHADKDPLAIDHVIKQFVHYQQKIASLKQCNRELHEENEVHQNRHLLLVDEIQIKHKQFEILQKQFQELRHSVGGNSTSISTKTAHLIEQINALQSENVSLIATLQRLENNHKVVITAKEKNIHIYRQESEKWRKSYEELFCSLLRKEGIPLNLLAALKSFHEGKDLAADITAQLEELKEVYFRSVATTIKLNIALRGKSVNFSHIDELYKNAKQTDWHTWSSWLLEQIQPSRKNQQSSWWT